MLAIDFDTEIKFNPRTGDFDLSISNQYVGSAPTYGEGRYRLDAIVLSKLTHSHPSAVNWSDRPDYDIPIEPDPDDAPDQDTDVDGIPAK